MRVSREFAFGILFAVGFPLFFTAFNHIILQGKSYLLESCWPLLYGGVLIMFLAILMLVEPFRKSEGDTPK